ncbi:MAG: hypothetical protein WB975_13055 [Nitrososphaeraceae archaeon]
MQDHKSIKTRIGVIIVLLTGVAVSGIASVLPVTYAQEQQQGRAESAVSSSTCPAKLVRDTAAGNAVGWDPNGARRTFLIHDNCYIAGDSTVLVNLKGAGFEVCNVDWNLASGSNRYFEVHCDVAPANFSELHYIIFIQNKVVLGAEPEAAPAVPKDFTDRLHK